MVTLGAEARWASDDVEDELDDEDECDDFLEIFGRSVEAEDWRRFAVAYVRFRELDSEVEDEVEAEEVEDFEFERGAEVEGR